MIGGPWCCSYLIKIVAEKGGIKVQRVGEMTHKRARRIPAHCGPPHSPMGGLAVSRLSNTSYARCHHESTVGALSLLEWESLTARLMEILAPHVVSSDSLPSNVEVEWTAFCSRWEGELSGLGGCLAALYCNESMIFSLCVGAVLAAQSVPHWATTPTPLVTNGDKIYDDRSSIGAH